MSEFDLVIRGGTVATAADVFRADIGVRAGRIAALATDLPVGRREIDADGLLAPPGGVDAQAGRGEFLRCDAPQSVPALHRREA